MTITRNGSHAPARVGGAIVTFEPGALNSLAPPSARTNPDRHVGLRTPAARRWPHRGDPTWRHRVVRAWREALARRIADDGDDPHRDSGSVGWKGGRLVGEGQRRTVREKVKR